MLFRYQERMHLSYQQAVMTPWAEIERASYIWKLDTDREKQERDKLEAEQEHNSGS